ncbi:hypothetical protein [Corynebacterium aquilae]|uniref:Uncharacterized protein n=1 Tax=Corynebacterium aquilae DSM 44791 TaxID=1431546 RepID=A0A1L7CE25_9CORY|nr:hypothetical protein [Corynebacterium aquilae]APT84078.1 hypothetical protein CAQU_02200 [Corynebacterium aquilae DSM 44791]
MDADSFIDIDSSVARDHLSTMLAELRAGKGLLSPPGALPADSAGRGFSDYAGAINELLQALHVQHTTMVSHVEAALLAATSTVDDIDVTDDSNSTAFAGYTMEGE